LGFQYYKKLNYSLGILPCFTFWQVGNLRISDPEVSSSMIAYAALELFNWGNVFEVYC